MNINHKINSESFLFNFIKKIGSLTLYNLGVILVYFFSQPFLRNIFSPSEYGKLDLILKLSAVFSSILSFKLEKLIPSEYKGSNILNNILGLIILNFTIMLLGLFLISFFLSSELNTILFYTLIISLLLSISQTLKLRSLDRGEINSFGLSALIKKVVEISSNLIIHKFGLVFGELTGYLVSYTVLVKEKFKISISESIKFLLNNKSIILLNLAPELLLAFSNFLLVYLVLYNFDLTVVGIYEMADKFIFLPLVLLSNPIGNVILESYSKLDKSEVLQQKTRNIIIITFSTSLVITLLVYLFSGQVIQLFFDDTWSDAERVIKISCPYLFLRMAISPYNQILLARRDLYGYNLTQVVRLISVLVLYTVNFYDLFSLAFAIMVSQSLAYIVIFLIILTRIRKTPSISE